MSNVFVRTVCESRLICSQTYRKGPDQAELERYYYQRALWILPGGQEAQSQGVRSGSKGGSIGCTVHLLHRVMPLQPSMHHSLLIAPPGMTLKQLSLHLRLRFAAVPMARLCHFARAAELCPGTRRNYPICAKVR